MVRKIITRVYYVANIHLHTFVQFSTSAAGVFFSMLIQSFFQPKDVRKGSLNVNLASQAMQGNWICHATLLY